MIAEILFTGQQNPRSASDLAAQLKLQPRQVTAQIEKERQAGLPICASCSGEEGQGGYYLAGDWKELDAYCGRLYSRLNHIHKTYNACMMTLEQMTGEHQLTIADAFQQRTVQG